MHGGTVLSQIVAHSNSPVVPWLTGTAAFSPSPPVPSATGPSSLTALEVRVTVTWILWSPTWEMTKRDALEGSGVTLYTFSVSPALLKLCIQKKRQNFKPSFDWPFPPKTVQKVEWEYWICACVRGGGNREAIINIKSQKKGVAQFWYLVTKHAILPQYHVHNHYMGWELRELELHDT